MSNLWQILFMLLLGLFMESMIAPTFSGLYVVSALAVGSLFILLPFVMRWVSALISFLCGFIIMMTISYYQSGFLIPSGGFAVHSVVVLIIMVFFLFIYYAVISSPKQY